jgi:hypothetical protein
MESYPIVPDLDEFKYFHGSYLLIFNMTTIYALCFEGFEKAFGYGIIESSQLFDSYAA